MDPKNNKNLAIKNLFVKNENLMQTKENLELVYKKILEYENNNEYKYDNKISKIYQLKISKIFYENLKNHFEVNTDD